MSKFTPMSVHDLGDYLLEQRHSAQLSLRQLSAVAGISNPYISQIERGLKKPSAEILQALAKALRISAESLYVRAGILDERADSGGFPAADVTEAILAEPRLNDRQRAVLLDVYESFVAEPVATKAPKAPEAPRPSESRPVPSQQGSTNPTEQTSSKPSRPTSPSSNKQSSTKPTKQASTKPTQPANTKEKQS